MSWKMRCSSLLRPGIRYLRILALTLVAAAIVTPAQATAIASAWRIGAREDGGSRFVLDLSAAVGFAHFVLANPDRVVIDLTQIEWRIPPTANLAGGLVTSARYGAFKPGVTRIVLDLGAPAKVQSIYLLPPHATHRHRLVVDLSPTSRTAFSASVHPPGQPTLEPGGRAKPALLPAPPAVTAAKTIAPPRSSSPTSTAAPTPAIKLASMILPPKLAPEASVKPGYKRRVVVIDPGHGGVDPGAISVSGVYEKNVTLAVAREMKRHLEESGRYRVVLTRDSDVFVRLRDRVAMGRAAGGHLFVSIHADAIGNPAISGLSVYTLSETASDKEAEALAAKENKADLISGIDLTGETNQVSGILIALAQRETKNHSAHFAGILIRELEYETRLLPRTHRFAGLAVLTGPDMPAVLLELGYLSNKDDERKLMSADHRRKLARGILRAADSYFAGNR